jgi:thiol:disulfide interchange protein DsbD
MNQIEPSPNHHVLRHRADTDQANRGLQRAPVFWPIALLLQCLALLFVLQTGPARAADDFLEPDQAFRLSARAADGATLELRYEIAPGYYMYRERFEVVAAPADVKLGAPAYPAGKVKYDETFQKDVETFRGDLRIPVPVTAAPAEFKVTVTSQGCADKGLCYPPRPQVLKVQVADAAIRSVTLLGDDEGQAWQPASAAAIPLVAGVAAPVTGPGAADAGAAAGAGDGVDAALRSGSLWTVVGVFLLAGLLLSFTPCVLPMMPILSSIIVGQGAQASRLKGFGLSLAYSLGMALVYTAMGVAAGLAGEGLAAALQKPAVLGAFAALLVLLSLSMFGWYELQLPAALQNRLNDASGRLQGGRFFGVFLMGGLSALIVGPCVAAPLAGALVYISQSRDVLLGGVALFALAAGMSVPLLLLGLSAGSLLPRAGVWMEGVKRFFGVLLLGTALWMLDPVLPTWLAMLAWGALALGYAVELRAFERLEAGASGLQSVGKAIGLLIALLGLVQVVGMLSGGRSLLQPLAHLGAKAAVVGTAPVAVAGAAAAGQADVGHGPTFRRVRSVAELDEALKTAGRPVMLDFYADWCVSCKEFEQFTFTDPAVRARLDRMLLLQADVTANNADDKALLKRFQLFGPPGIVFFDAQGHEVTGRRVIGFQDAPRFLASLAAAGIGP